MNNKNAFVMLPVVAVVIAAYFYLVPNLANSNKIEDGVQADTAAATTHSVTQAETIAASAENAESEESTEIVEVSLSNETNATAGIDVEKALAERGIGNPEAPTRIEEFASLTCSHCANFHENVFPALKEKYIDTGKVYFVFTDFPLNGPALEASAVARCLPDSRYFKFISFLFETQKDWAFNADYSMNIKQNAKLLGLDEATHSACVGNDDLKNGLIDRMQTAGQENEIDSTPSFLVNGSTVVTGVGSLDKLSKVIDPLLAAK